MIEYVITEHWNGLGQSWQVSKHETTETGGTVTYLRTFNDIFEAERFIRFQVTGGARYIYDETGNRKSSVNPDDEIPF